MSDAQIHLLLVFVLATAGAYFFFGLDDFLVDLYAWIRRLGPTELTMDELSKIDLKPEKRIAIMIASWKEAGVLHKMIAGNHDRIDYGRFEFFLGVYPNDTETLREAQELTQIFGNIHVVVNPLHGPTSKGQMVNQIVRAILRHEDSARITYDALLMHDSEDLIHPRSLKLINWLLDRHDFIQIPIFSLPLPASKLVAGVYMDEFSECHTKDILVRNDLGAPVPSAGTGTALSRRLVQEFTQRNGGNLLNQKSLTEDYELGVSVASYGLKSIFACYFVRSILGSRDFIATRAYFPKSFNRSVIQKTRWTVGIAFQGAAHLGWTPSLIQNYFLYRDRKGPVTNTLAFVGMFSIVAVAPLYPVFHANATSVLLVLACNSFFMLNRIFQRVLCTARVYGLGVALLAPVRLPIGNVINAFASCRAFVQYVRHKLTGVELRWAKTQHELPADFGIQPPRKVS